MCISQGIASLLGGGGVDVRYYDLINGATEEPMPLEEAEKKEEEIRSKIINKLAGKEE